MLKALSQFKKRSSQDKHDYLVTKDKSLSYITESFNKIILNLEAANVDHKYKVIQLTSTLPSEGKSTCVVNLAYMLCKQQKKVLMIDMDIRKPRIHRIFKLSNDHGLTDYLIHDISIEDTIKKIGQGKIDVIVAGKTTSLITNLLISNKIKKLIEEVRERYDYIIIDSPPVISVSDPLYISNFVDGVIFAIAENKAKKPAIREAINALKQQKADLIGVIYTQSKSSYNRYKSKYYREYYLKEN